MSKGGPPPQIVLSPTSLEIAIRDSGRVAGVVIAPADWTHDIRWFSSDTTIAVVRADYVVGVRAGNVQIVATAGTLNAAVPVTVLAVNMSPVRGGVYARDGGGPVPGAVVTARAFSQNGCMGEETARQAYTTAADGTYSGSIRIAQPTKPGWDCVEISVAPPPGSGLAPESEVLQFGGDVVYPVMTWAAISALQPAAPPEPAAGARTWSAVSAAGHHTCALAADGTVACWGYNRYGQVGAPVTGSCFTPSGTMQPATVPCGITPASVPGSGMFTGVSVQGEASCVLSQGGGLSCWGDNRASTPVTVATLEPFSVFSGSCGVARDGRAYCWSPFSPFLGTLGPVRMAPPLASISGQGSLGCGVALDGRGWCWGNRWNGQVGDGNVFSEPTSGAVRVASAEIFADISVGDGVTCGRTINGDGYCWGLDDRGQLGAGRGNRQTCFQTYVGRGSTPPCSGTPLKVEGGLRVADITAGGSHVCALTAAGDAWCWGDNAYGELGIGAPDTLAHPQPLPVAGGMRFRSIAAGSGYTCAVAESGGLYCWGYNLYGQLGTGSLADRARPTRVSGSAP